MSVIKSKKIMQTARLYTSYKKGNYLELRVAFANITSIENGEPEFFGIGCGHNPHDDIEIRATILNEELAQSQNEFWKNANKPGFHTSETCLAKLPLIMRLGAKYMKRFDKITSTHGKPSDYISNLNMLLLSMKITHLIYHGDKTSWNDICEFNNANLEKLLCMQLKDAQKHSW